MWLSFLPLAYEWFLDNIAPCPITPASCLAFLLSAVNQRAYTVLFATSERTRVFRKLASSGASDISGHQRWKKEDAARSCRMRVL
jgi:hypothetical protein